MTSTASQRLRLDKQATGDNPDAWGDRLNGVIDLVDEAFGFAEIAVNGNVALSQQNFVSDQSRRMVLRFTGAGGFSVTIPAVEHMYYIDNRCAVDVILKTASTPGSAVAAGTKRIAYCDGATVTTDTSSVAPSAGDVAFNPIGTIAATNVQDAVAEVDNEKVAKAGDTMSGQLLVPGLVVQGAAGTSRPVFFRTGTQNRWSAYVDPSAETGSSVGSDFVLARYTDSGTFVDIPFSLSRSTGRLALSGRPTWGGAIPYDSTNNLAVLSNPGYVKLQNGFILQWGNQANPASDYTQLFPINFPAALISVTVTANANAGTSGSAYIANSDGGTVAGFNIRTRRVDNGGSVTSQAGLPICWLAVGY